MMAVTLAAGLLLFVMIFALFAKSRPILSTKPVLDLLLGTAWNPSRGEFGFLPFIAGTLWVTGVAVIIAVPLCLLTAIFLSEYSPRWLREFAKPPIDLLAGIPSVVYGVWGVIVVVPFIKNHVGPAFGTHTSGYSILAGGVVLAIMIFPVIIHISLEVLGAVKFEVREVSLALGATRWQTVKHAILRKASPGIFAAVVLGLSRAFGETMAVLMVTGNVARLPHSVFQPAYTLPALIANNYGEMLSIPLYDSALMLASLILLLVTLIFNIMSQAILVRLERRVV
jgi:phosphate transport system permease protein